MGAFRELLVKHWGGKPESEFYDKPVEIKSTPFKTKLFKYKLDEFFQDAPVSEWEKLSEPVAIAYENFNKYVSHTEIKLTYLVFERYYNNKLIEYNATK